MSVLKFNLLLILLSLFLSSPLQYAGHNFNISDNSLLNYRTFCFQGFGSSRMCKANFFVSNLECFMPQNATAGPCDVGKPAGQWVLYTIMPTAPYTLYATDTTTGQITVVGNVTGITTGHIASGITWDNTTNTMFISSTNLTQSRIYTLNMQTLNATTVGNPITNAPALHAIDANPAGSIFGIDISNDNFYRINKNTGAAVMVGPLGYNFIYATDTDFDPRDGILYIFSLSIQFQLRSIDTSTGMSTFIGGTPALSDVTGITFAPAGLIGIEPNGNEIPENFSLSQNYPNPFNPSTVITYGLLKKELVQISVFDITGKEVLKLNEGFKPAGIYSVSFDGSNFPSGVYFYKITAGEFTDAKKMVLIK